MAHTDPFMFLPIVSWIFVTFWFIYMLVSAYFLPMIYKAFRARTLIFSYLSNDLFVQMSSIMGFYYILSKTTSNFYALMLKFVSLSFVLLNSKAVLFLTKVNYLHKLSKRILKTM